LQPFQILTTLKWLTIPATAILSFMFFGFLVAGEEIESRHPHHPSFCISR
jgi:putative membrane protein